MSGSYTISLNESDMDCLLEDYLTVESVIDIIMEQAKAQGYMTPEEREKKEESA